MISTLRACLSLRQALRLGWSVSLLSFRCGTLHFFWAESKAAFYGMVSLFLQYSARQWINRNVTSVRAKPPASFALVHTAHLCFWWTVATFRFTEVKQHSNVILFRFSMWGVMCAFYWNHPLGSEYAITSTCTCSLPSETLLFCQPMMLQVCFWAPWYQSCVHAFLKGKLWGLAGVFLSSLSVMLSIFSWADFVVWQCSARQLINRKVTSAYAKPILRNRLVQSSYFFVDIVLAHWSAEVKYGL